MCVVWGTREMCAFIGLSSLLSTPTSFTHPFFWYDARRLLIAVALLDSTVKVFYDNSLRFFLRSVLIPPYHTRVYVHTHMRVHVA